MPVIFPSSIHLETVQFKLFSFNTEVVHFSSLQKSVASLILYVSMVLQNLCPYLLHRSDFFDCFDSLGGVLHGYFPLCSLNHSIYSWTYVGRNGGRNQILHYTQTRKAIRCSGIINVKTFLFSPFNMFDLNMYQNIELILI